MISVSVMKTILPKTRRSIALTLIAVLSLITSIVPAAAVDAAISSGSQTFISQDVLGDVKRRQNYYWLRACFELDDIDKTTKSEIDGWDFFKGNGDETLAIGGIYGAGEDAMWSCSSRSNVERAFNYLGFNDGRKAFCSIAGASFGDGGGNSKDTDWDECVAGAGADDDHYWDNDVETKHQQTSFDNLIKNGVSAPTGVEPIPTIENMTPEMHFVRYYESLIKGCKMTLSGDVVTAARKDELDVSDGKKYLVPIVDSSGDIGYQVGIRAEQFYYVPFVATVTFNGSSENTKYGNTGSMDVKTCGDLAAGARDYAARYAAYVKTHPQDEAADHTGGGDADNAPVCSAGALGWVLCPLSEAMVAAIEGIAALLENLLIFQPLTDPDNEQGKAIRTIWGSLLVIANAGLIIAFLVVVFSQATSIGISNYGIKKLLPRVIAAAILMNLSFYICAAAVDISNIAGVSVKGIVDAGLAQISTASTNPDLRAGASVGEWIAISSVGLLAAAVAVATGAIFLLIPVLLTAVMSIFTALIIIAARQVLITLLIIIAPLAILAWILPNTEQWFTRWRKLFTTLLLMFPMVMAIFYGSVLVSSVTLAAAGQSGNSVNDFSIKLLAFLVLIVPLFSLPFVIKSAGGVLDRIGLIANNRNKGLIDRSRKKAEELKARSPYQQFKPIRKQAREDLRRQRTANRLAKAYDPNQKSSALDNYRRAQAGGVTEVGRIVGETRPVQAAKRGATKAATKGVSGLYGVSPTLGDLGSQAVAGTSYVANNLPGNEMRTTQRQAVLRSATAQVDKAFEQAVADAATTQKNTSSETFELMAQDKMPGISEAEHVAAARWVMANGNFAQRKSLYESIHEKSSDRLRQTVSSQFFAKGDNAIIGATYGGLILEGTSGGVEGLREATAANINAKKVTAQSMVHDADATKLLLDVAVNAGTYGVTAGGIGSLQASATEAVRNETTRTKATAGVFSEPITEITRLSNPGGGGGGPIPPPTPPTGGGPTPPPAGGGGTPPTPPPVPPTAPSSPSPYSSTGMPTPQSNPQSSQPTSGGSPIPIPTPPAAAPSGGQTLPRPVPTPPRPGSLAERLARASALPNNTPEDIQPDSSENAPDSGQSSSEDGEQ